MSTYIIIAQSNKTPISIIEPLRHYTILKERKFFWFKWWEQLEINGEPCRFETYEEARTHFRKLKK